MLYQIGPISMDTFPFNADKFKRKASADIAKKPVIGTLKPKEFMGEGDEQITLSGQLLPSKIGGLSELDALDNFRTGGASLPVIRGDGVSLGWYIIENVSEDHTELMRDGVGFKVSYSISLTKSQPDGGAVGIIGAVLDLFELSGA